MKIWLSILILLTSGLCFSEPTFKLHVNTEPTSLSPFFQKSASGSYVFSQLHSPLLWFQNGKLKDNIAHCTQTHPNKIQCKIFSWAKFSNGEKIMAEHFQKMFAEFLNPKNPALRADLLLPIKNAKDILDGKTPIDKLGVKSKNELLLIELEKANYEFIHNLANPLLSPLFNIDRKNGPYDENWVTSGPYKLKSWEPKSKIILEPNPFYPGKRPTIEFYFVTEDTVAMTMYEKGDLDFLRRLPTLYIAKFKDRKDFHAIDQFRLDSIALNAEIPEDIRLKLLNAPDYLKLQKLLFAKEPPGCVGIPKSVTGKTICLEKKVSINTDGKAVTSILNLTYVHSKQGGDDQSRIAQWFQSEWEINARIKVGISEVENKVFLESLRNNPPMIFHKGLAPDRATCLSVLENFHSNSAENYIQYQNSHFDKLIEKLSIIHSDKEKKQICAQAISLLLKSKQLIPTGPIYFSLLVKPEWKNWTLNELNILNLTHLKWDKDRLIDLQKTK